MHWVAFLIGAFLPITAVRLHDALGPNAQLVLTRARAAFVALRAAAISAGTRIYRARFDVASIG
jgi:hypothetical protein